MAKKALAFVKVSAGVPQYGFCDDGFLIDDAFHLSRCTDLPVVRIVYEQVGIMVAAKKVPVIRNAHRIDTHE